MPVNADLMKAAKVKPVHMTTPAGAGSPTIAQAGEIMLCQILPGKEVAVMGV